MVADRFLKMAAQSVQGVFVKKSTVTLTKRVPYSTSTFDIRIDTEA